MKKERVEKPCCPTCRHKGLVMLPYDYEMRPAKVCIQCNQCKRSWCSGRYAKDYQKFVMNLDEVDSILEGYRKYHGD